MDINDTLGMKVCEARKLVIHESFHQAMMRAVFCKGLLHNDDDDDDYINL